MATPDPTLTAERLRKAATLIERLTQPAEAWGRPMSDDERAGLESIESLRSLADDLDGGHPW